MNTKKQFINGFTIVELLVVAAIIGILAAITVVSYAGITQRAVVTSLQSDLNNAADLLRIDQAHSSTSYFPTSLSAANGGKGIPVSSGTTYTYQYNNTNTPQTFCLTATKSNQNYNINQEGIPFAGPCPVLWLDAGITTSYPGTGTTWNDLSGNGYNGTLNGGVSYNNTNNGVLSFDGISGYANAGNGSNLNITNTITLEAWVNARTQTSLYNGIVSKTSSNSNGWEFRTTSYTSTNTNIEFRLNGDLGSAGPFNLVNNQWYYLVGTYDGANTKLYVNVAVVASHAYVSSILTNATNLQVGKLGYANLYFNGLINNVRVYNVALSANDVNKNFNALRGRYGL